MKPEPLVSVIVPAFNAQDFIAEALDSVLAQTYGNLEILVVDDGSIDQTPAITQGYGPLVSYHRQENKGVSSARNTGIRMSSGEFICFLDADDIMLPDRVARQVDFLRRHASLGLVFSDYHNFNERELSGRSHFQTCPALRTLLGEQEELVVERSCKILVQENFGIAGSFLMRRKLLESVSGFEKTLKGGEDFHFYFRLARYSPVGIINKVGMLRRFHDKNATGDAFMMLTEIIRALALLREGEQDPEVRELLNRYILRCKTDLARYHADQGRFFESLKYDCQVLSRPFYGRETIVACRNMVRTFLMAARIHNGKRRAVQS